MPTRRAFIAIVGGTVFGAPLATYAQQRGKVYRVGFLWDSPAMYPDAMQAFRRELGVLGWKEGANLVIEPRWTEGRFDRADALAEELVRMKVDVIVAPSSLYTGAARKATSTIPIVFMSHADPVGSLHVASLARPGGNATGLSLMMTETNAKSLELFKEIIPRLTRVAALYDPATPSHTPGLKALVEAGQALGLRVQLVPAANATEFAPAFSSIAREHTGGVLVLSTPLFIAAAPRLAELALANKLPAMFGPRVHAETGGFVSFGPDRADLWRRGASVVDKVLKGAKPQDLPVQQPTKFELVINNRTAKALGVVVPQSVLARADQVIG